MTKFQRRGQIILLYKKGDKRDPLNHRPITLLNMDAKIPPKVLARRMGPALQTILGEDQYGFVPSRDIRNAHLRFQALQQLYKKKNTTAGAVLLDFAKAFDSVVWDALDLTLTHFGFGENFCEWVKTFFKDSLVSILFNGDPLPSFQIGAGVRQGDPLSPALFVIYIEPLLNLLRATMKDKGLRSAPQDPSHTVISFADDVTGLLHDLKDAPAFLEVVNEFCEASGMKLNTDKTVILPFKPWNDDTRPLQNDLQQLGVQVIMNDEETKLLGIFYGPNLTSLGRLKLVLEKMQDRCSKFHYRARTLRGRVVLLQSMILPVLDILQQCVSYPKSVFSTKLKK
ncbi:hypothetical protein Poli38472_014945 [Pythium oligandrum]|nr:hypothetical protein Poli38472_014945 [Pythium oligandrum]|eukprot:TMW60975.1 hypothetical protein Poli38472_014945 [Pythium oligandrum]